MHTLKHSLLFVVALLALGVGLGAAPSLGHAQESTLADRAGLDGLGLSCGDATATGPDGLDFTYTLCTGEVESWDRLKLETILAFPKGAKEPLPTVFSPSAGGTSRAQNWITASTEHCCFFHHWNVPWFVSRGYAFLASTPRGLGGSCGPADPDADCTLNNRWTHVAERGWEGQDSRHLLGLAVDAGIAHPRRLAATGNSYGGGLTWLLATELPWETPARKSDPNKIEGETIQLAAAVPFEGWTDVLQFPLPNGRAGDKLDQKAAHEVPLGVFRQGSWELTPFSPGLVFHGFRVNDQDPSDDETHSFIDGWTAFFNKGEPYDTDEGRKLAKALRGKSAYYATDYLAAVRGRAAPAVPIFVPTEWLDWFFFGPQQTLQMYRELKKADPGYPIWMAFGQFGLHVGTPTGDDPSGDEAGLVVALRDITAQANQFLDAFVRGVGNPPSAKVISYRHWTATDPQPELLGAGRCPRPIDCTFQSSTTIPCVQSLRVQAQSWDQLTRDVVILSQPGARMTTTTPAEPDEEAKTLLATQCHTQGPADPASLAARWTWKVNSSITYIGLPRLTVKYEVTMAGDPIPKLNASVVVRLWDVFPEDHKACPGCRLLVDRGVYRLAATGNPALDDPETGTLQFELFGNHWRFEAGHTILLELSQTEAPFFRPNNFPSSIEFSAPELTLPVP